MISIIISSVNEALLTNVKKNIEQTIGVPYEIISFDNSKGERGLCQLYNEGARNAKFEVLCFMHEDLILHTQNWGANVVKRFEEDRNLGIIGNVGSIYKSEAPSGWSAITGIDNVVFSNYIQHYKHSDKAAHHIYTNQLQVELAEVVCVDGMWFCSTKTVVSKHPFDEETFKGFHCYDVDFCLNVGQHYKIYTVFDVLMEHLSEGSYSRGWVDDTLKLHRKWQSSLPRATKTISSEEKRNIERRAYKMFFKVLKKLNYPLAIGNKVLSEALKGGRINQKLYLKLKYYWFKYRFLGFSEN